MKFQVKMVCVWNSYELPSGYALAGLFVVDPSKDLFFVIGVPFTWSKTASQFELAQVVGNAVTQELIQAVKK